MIGPPKQRRSGHFTFVSFCRFLALIFANQCLRFLLGLSLVRQSRTERAEFLQGSGRNLTEQGNGLQRRYLAAVKTHRHTLTHWNEQQTLNGGSRWLHTLTFIYQNPVYSGWQDRAAEESTSPGKMDAARSAAVRGAWQLWPEAIPKDLDGDWCYTEVASAYREKRYNGLEKHCFMSKLWGRLDVGSAFKSVFINYKIKVNNKRKKKPLINFLLKFDQAWDNHVNLVKCNITHKFIMVKVFR